jgi:acetyl-CoA carboxylase biotin carboxyl carrier protein
MIEDNATVRAEGTLRALRVALVGVLDAAPVRPARVRLSVDGAEIDVSWHEVSGPAMPTVLVDPPPDASAGDTHVVRAPLVGTFYRAREPGSAPFVEVGDIVTCGQQLGIIEAMKLMNTIAAGSDGRVVELLVVDGSPVEFDQPLILIDPAQVG